MTWGMLAKSTTVKVLVSGRELTVVRGSTTPEGKMG